MSDTYPLVLLTDFGTGNRFAASMKGVAISIEPDLRIYDLTHDVEPYNILEGAYLLADAIKYWPAGTVFVVVIDPGVGTDRRSLACRTETGHIIICPDNGLLSIVREETGINEIREVDIEKNRLPGSGSYHTFHGRDIYAYNGARIAAGKIGIEDLGQIFDGGIMRLSMQAPVCTEDKISGNIIMIERPFGNLSSDIPGVLIERAGWKEGCLLDIRLIGKEEEIKLLCPYVRSFGYVETGAVLCYTDSAGRLGLAVSQGNFSNKYKIQKARDLRIELQPVR